MKQPEFPTSIFDRVRFVLVETSRAGNIGAAARAMKTMGFSELVLVNPRNPDALADAEAVAFASGAQDILAGARIVGSVTEATAGCNFVAGLSARLREFSPPVCSPDELSAQLQSQTDWQAALLFGNERFGLPNEVVQQCNALINIPANPAYSSLNLAQAVQILAYECRRTALAGQPVQATGIGFTGERAEAGQVEGMFNHLQEALITLEFLDPDNPKKLMPRLRRLFGRTQLETEEVNILRGIAAHIQSRCKKK